MNEDTFLIIDWRFSTNIGEYQEGEKYVTEIFGSVYSVNDDDGQKQTLIGKIKLILLHLDMVISEGYDAEEVWDGRKETMDIGEVIYDFDSYEFNQQTQELYDEGIIQANVLIIDRVELLPSYRGRGLCTEILKDVVSKFSGGCGLVALKAFPLQCEATMKENSWRKKMRYKKMELDHAKAFPKLRAFYSSLGFKSIPETEIMVLNPTYAGPLVI